MLLPNHKSCRSEEEQGLMTSSWQFCWPWILLTHILIFDTLFDTLDTLSKHTLNFSFDTHLFWHFFKIHFCDTLFRHFLTLFDNDTCLGSSGLRSLYLDYLTGCLPFKPYFFVFLSLPFFPQIRFSGKAQVKGMSTSKRVFSVHECFRYIVWHHDTFFDTLVWHMCFI